MVWKKSVLKAFRLPSDEDITIMVDYVRRCKNKKDTLWIQYNDYLILLKEYVMNNWSKEYKKNIKEFNKIVWKSLKSIFKQKKNDNELLLKTTGFSILNIYLEYMGERKNETFSMSMTKTREAWVQSNAWRYCMKRAGRLKRFDAETLKTTITNSKRNNNKYD